MRSLTRAASLFTVGLACVHADAQLATTLSTVSTQPAAQTASQTNAVVSTGWDSTTTTSLQAAGRILNQASFGPTINDVFAVESSGIASYLDAQFKQPAYIIPAANPQTVTTGDCQSFSCDTEYYWWNDVIFGSDQLRQRVAFELSKLFVVSIDTVDPRYLPNYLNLLSQDAFGNWFNLMQDVALSPAMGTYLNMANSTTPTAGQSANENFAREMMQLFSIGVYALNQDGSLKLDGNGNPIANYTSAQVQNFALAYTGWTFANNDCSAPSSANYYWYNLPPGQSCPMTVLPYAHSTVSKTLLRGTVLPAGQSAQQDLTGALTNIFNDPSMPPFVAQHLIQSLVKSNPSPAYISRVAAAFTDNGSGVRGDMKAIITAILMDPEARADDNGGISDANGGKLRDPILWWASVMRAMGATSTATVPNVAFFEQRFDLWLADLDERPHVTPSVFSYYSPSFQLQGTSTYAPEFQNENTLTISQMAEHMQDAITDNWSENGVTATEFAMNLTANSFWGEAARTATPTNLVNALDALLLHGTMTQGMQQAIVTSIQGLDPATMVRCAVYLIVTSPQYRLMM
ncbi:DUF1800 family protein [Acidipila sp. EB88]|uniref:DUF1800 family protein n=1 Tax=Acidipila sp. EB88 TaxID=2305226 RepID=UPI0013154727|nr:DUF1800 family protein [Acidipila sp. EB88]